MKEIKKIYFVGAGGIGMANLVRYYLAHGVPVAGYDRTRSALTDRLEAEGAQLTFTDSEDEVPADFRNPEETLVVYTPAVPESNKILSMFRAGGFEVIKRAALLGIITRNTDAICIAGSHGKTTTCSMTANILRDAKPGCTAFLGGILRNTGSNLVLNEKSRYSVIEADEYDRSFHQLRPWTAIITSTDPDHLDIYGDEDHYLEAFSIFTSLIRPGGNLITHTGLKYKPNVSEDVHVYTYSGGSEGDFHASDVKIGDGRILFTLEGPDGLRIENLSPGVPVEINIENAVAAAAAAWLAGATADEIRNGLSTFKGAKRRFEVYLDGTEGAGCGPVLIDDYAHSPNEVKASIRSVKKLYPNKELTVIFQPHLYTRTRDFADEFAEALSHADRVIMPEIYPARELPIEGVSTYSILDKVKSKEKIYCERKDLLELIKNSNFEILMTLGAADIDRMLPDIVRELSSRKG
jgi:UDP-N-acetylmuramate--alanine ligase